jgi:hypothetical protein
MEEGRGAKSRKRNASNKKPCSHRAFYLNTSMTFIFLPDPAFPGSYRSFFPLSLQEEQAF